MKSSDMNRRLARMEQRLAVVPVGTSEDERSELVLDVLVANAELEACKLMADMYRKIGQHAKSDEHAAMIAHHEANVEALRFRSLAAGIVEEEIASFVRR